MFRTAKWLASHDNNMANTYTDFFETCTVTKTEKPVLFRVSADSDYALYINGSFVNCGQFADFSHYKVYDELDVTSFLQDGKNTFRITLYSENYGTLCHAKDTPSICYELVCDGTCLFASNETTQTAVCAPYHQGEIELITGQLGFTFAYDARKETETPVTTNATVLERNLELYPRPSKKVVIGEPQCAKIQAHGNFHAETPKQKGIGAEMQFASLAYRERLHPVATVPNTNGIPFTTDNGFDGIYITLDLGKESVGFPALELDLPCDAKILIGYGEHLEDLRPRTSVGARNFTATYYGKSGHNKFFHPFRRFGLRYMQIHVYAPSCVLYYAGIRPADYPLSYEPEFHCADHLHEKIYSVARDTLRLCMHEHYEDCPWREQALYAMDSRNQMLCGYYAFGEFAFPKASLRLMAKSLRKEGVIAMCAPSGGGMGNLVISSFTYIYPVQLYEYAIHSGDIEGMNEMFPVAKTIVDTFLARRHANGLIPRYPAKRDLPDAKEEDPHYWNFYEWSPRMSGNDLSNKPVEPNENRPVYDDMQQGFASLALQAVASMCRINGDKEGAAYYTEQANAINEAAHRIFYDPDRGAYRAFPKEDPEEPLYNELCQSLMIVCGACPEDKIDGILEQMKDHRFVPATLSHNAFKFEAFMKREKTYGKFVFEEIAREWGAMLYVGATSFWETQKGMEDFGHAGSLCHGWSAVPIYFYLRYGCGMKINPDGSGTYTLEKPNFNGIYECRGKLLTANGMIESENCQ